MSLIWCVWHLVNQAALHLQNWVLVRAEGEGFVGKKLKNTETRQQVNGLLKS